MLYGKHWDPNREPCFLPDLKGDSPADPNLLKLRLFGLVVKAVFTLPISSAIAEMLFSRSTHAAPPTRSAAILQLSARCRCPFWYLEPRAPSQWTAVVPGDTQDNNMQARSR